MSIADKLATIAENEQKVYDAGYERGNQAGYDAGRYDEWSDFWDAFQSNGTRTNYKYAFSNDGWNNDNFNPKHDIKVIDGFYMFRNNAALTKSITSKDLGITIDFSQATELRQAFNGAHITKVGVVDLSNINGDKANQMFAYNYSIKTIEKIISNESIDYTNVFEYAPALKNVIFEGVIGRNFNIKNSDSLSKESISSIIKALSTTSSGLTASFSLRAINKAFETTPGAADGSQSEEWATLEGTKTNWTISLV